MRAITFRALQDQACLKQLLGRLCSAIPSEACAGVSESLGCSTKLCHHVSTDASGASPSRQLLLGSSRPAHSFSHPTGRRPNSVLHKHSAQLHHAACRCTGGESPAAAGMSMPLAPGSQVIVDMSLSSRDVQVLVNDDPEAMSWQVPEELLPHAMAWTIKQWLQWTAT